MIFVLLFVIRIGMIFLEIIFGDEANEPEHDAISYLNGIDDIIFGEYYYQSQHSKTIRLCTRQSINHCCKTDKINIFYHVFSV